MPGVGRQLALHRGHGRHHRRRGADGVLVELRVGLLLRRLRRHVRAIAGLQRRCPGPRVLWGCMQSGSGSV